MSWKSGLAFNVRLGNDEMKHALRVPVDPMQANVVSPLLVRLVKPL